jgi:3',5'-cyclic AMP phosphodiesterase CpdA
VIALGDLAYPNGDTKSFQCFAKHWGQHRDVLLAVPGNHDWRTDNGGPYFDYFAGSPVMPEDKGHKGYYSVDFPENSEHAWQLIGINTNEGYGAKAGQMKWLDGVLKESKNRCVLLFSHAFRFSSGDHGHNDGKSKVAVPQTHLKAAYGLLHKHRGSVILSGHDHHFEQFGPQDVNGKSTPKGLRSFIVGTGGFTPYPEHKTFAPNSVKRIWRTHGVLKIVMYPDRYEASFLNINGTTVKLLPESVMCNTRP